MKKLIIGLVVAAFLGYKSMTIFVMPPIEPVSKGATYIMWKDKDLGFLASPDSVCAKETRTPKMICRGAIMGKYADERGVIVKLPYLQPLHWLSSGN